MTNLAHNVVLITGASSEIGHAAVQLLARRGARVVIGARRLSASQGSPAKCASGGTAEYRALDVTQLADVQAFAHFALQQFGTIPDGHAPRYRHARVEFHPHMRVPIVFTIKER